MILLAACAERPDLAPGATMAGGAEHEVIAPTLPRDYQQAPAYQTASQTPQRYPTLLYGAQWCLPITGGPGVFEAPTPAGVRLRMGHVEQLLAELHDLNRQTLQLSPAALAAARHHAPARDAPRRGCRAVRACHTDRARRVRSRQPLLLDHGLLTPDESRSCP